MKSNGSNASHCQTDKSSGKLFSFNPFWSTNVNVNIDNFKGEIRV